MPTTVWRGHIAFGLVSIPVRMFRAARSERVKLRDLYRVEQPAPAPLPSRSMRVTSDLSVLPAPSRHEPEVPEMVAPVKRAPVNLESNQVIRSEALTKGFEVEKDRFVTLDRDELKSLEPKTATEMEILEFVRLAEVDPVYFEASYYAHPEEPGEQAYALLYEAMRQTGLVGLARLAMHRREHIVILRPGRSGILAHTMYFEGEVRSDQEYRADTASLNPRNLQLAKMLTESLAARFEPAKYRDTYREKLEALIAAKRRGEPAAVAPSPEPARRVVDITDALRKSIAATKKPAAVSQPRRPPKPRRRA